MSEIWSYMYMCIGLHVKYQLLLSHFYETWNSLDIFSNNIHVSNIVKSTFIRSRVDPCGLTFIRRDRQVWRSQYSLFAILRTRLKTLAHFLNLFHIKLFMSQYEYSMCLKKLFSLITVPRYVVVTSETPSSNTGVGGNTFFSNSVDTCENTLHCVFNSGFKPRNVFCQYF
jgi:hypothetical protein